MPRCMPFWQVLGFARGRGLTAVTPDETILNGHRGGWCQPRSFSRYRVITKRPNAFDTDVCTCTVLASICWVLALAFSCYHCSHTSPIRVGCTWWSTTPKGEIGVKNAAEWYCICEAHHGWCSVVAHKNKFPVPVRPVVPSAPCPALRWAVVAGQSRCDPVPLNPKQATFTLLPGRAHAPGLGQFRVPSLPVLGKFPGLGLWQD
ncbi:hypothetical protein B0H63DRAFT_473486 [Podospora didyma]|uniref:Uncharacterized protein n=1 Tax=Podospora didyma TaxID=330526 RepID=A0AAE0NQJ3_9PEZI|nr:hypothetical protein B0H63DRAFT_473486 [Podospora didyma]